MALFDEKAWGPYDIYAEGANVLDLVACRFPRDLALIILEDVPHSYPKMYGVVAHTTYNAAMLELRVVVRTPEALQRQFGIWHSSSLQVPFPVPPNHFEWDEQREVQMLERCRAARIPFFRMHPEDRGMPIEMWPQLGKYPPTAKIIVFW